MSLVGVQIAVGDHLGQLHHRGGARELGSRAAPQRVAVGHHDEKRYADADRLLITADCGGSNGNRVRLWKTEDAPCASVAKSFAAAVST